MVDCLEPGDSPEKRGLWDGPFPKSWGWVQAERVSPCLGVLKLSSSLLLPLLYSLLTPSPLFPPEPQSPPIRLLSPVGRSGECGVPVLDTLMGKGK